MVGLDVQLSLERAGITVNRNAIPYDPLPPFKAGGVRIGCPAVTTRGMREAEMDQIAGFLSEVMSQLNDAAVEQRIRDEVAALASRFPLYVRRLEQAEAMQGRLHATRAIP